MGRGRSAPQEQGQAWRTMSPPGLSSLNDCYMPLELKINLHGKSVGGDRGFRLRRAHHHEERPDLKDIATLRRIAQTYATISFTVTTTDDALAAKIEPGAPPSTRFAAMRKLADSSIQIGVTMMPILPFIEDTEVYRPL